MYQSTVEEQLNDTGDVKSRLERVASRCVVEVPRDEWAQTRRAAKFWKAMFTRLKVREAKFRAEVAELHREHSSELKLRRKVLRLKARLKALSGDSSGSSPVLFYFVPINYPHLTEHHR